MQNLKKTVEESPFEIKIHNQNDFLGSVRINLGKPYNGRADKMWFGQRYMVEAQIFDKTEKNEIGLLRCFCLLQTEDCVKCKYCDNNYLVTTIQTHAKR